MSSFVKDIRLIARKDIDHALGQKAYSRVCIFDRVRRNITRTACSYLTSGSVQVNITVWSPTADELLTLLREEFEGVCFKAHKHKNHIVIDYDFEHYVPKT